jgi:hypothetical protein
MIAGEGMRRGKRNRTRFRYIRVCRWLYRERWTFHERTVPAIRFTTPGEQEQGSQREKKYGRNGKWNGVCRAAHAQYPVS